MSKFRIVNLVDKIFITSAVFLICFAWLNFYFRNLIASFFIALIFTCAFVFILFYILANKNEKIRIKKENKQKIENCFLNFSLLNDFDKLKFLKTTIDSDSEITIKANQLTYTKNGIKHCLVVSKNEVLDFFGLINLIASNNDNSIQCFDIVASDFSPEIDKQLFNKQINFINKEKLFFDHFDKYKIYPKSELIENKKTSFNWKKFFLNMFRKEKSKSYFLCGLVLLFSSVIIPFHIYYIIFGTLFLVFSVVCKLLPSSNFY